MTTTYPTPHSDKLQALLNNNKLPEADKPRVDEAIERYGKWIKEIGEIQGEGDEIIDPLVASLDRYRKWIDLDLIFDSKADFLHRQKGQLKLDNSVLEEFLPILVIRRFPELVGDIGLNIGPTTAFSQLRLRF